MNPVRSAKESLASFRIFDIKHGAPQCARVHGAAPRHIRMRRTAFGFDSLCTPEAPREYAGPALASFGIFDIRQVKTAMFCRDAVVPGESRPMFELLRQHFIHDLKPQNVTELSIVDRIAIAQWKLRRVQSAEVALYKNGYEAVAERTIERMASEPEFDESEIVQTAGNITRWPDMPGRIALEGLSGDLSELSRLEQRLEYSVHRWMRELERVRKMSAASKALPESMFDRLAETIEEANEGMRGDSESKEKNTEKSEHAEVRNEEEDALNVTRASRPCAEHENLDTSDPQQCDSEQSDPEQPAQLSTGETPVSQESDESSGEIPQTIPAEANETPQRDTSNMKNEPNPVCEPYMPAAVELWRKKRPETPTETNPVDSMIANRDRCAAHMARIYEVPLQTFDGMNIPAIIDEVKQIKTDRGQPVNVEEVELLAWGSIHQPLIDEQGNYV